MKNKNINKTTLIHELEEGSVRISGGTPEKKQNKIFLGW